MAATWSTAPLHIAESNMGREDFEIAATPRIGIDYAEADKDLLWRFVIADSPFISVKKFTEGIFKILIRFSFLKV